VESCEVILESGEVCGWIPPPDARPNALGLHRWSAHGIKKDGTRVDRSKPNREDPAGDDQNLPSPFTPPPGPSGEVPPVRGGADRSADGPAPRRRGLFGFFKRDKAPKPAPRPSNERAPRPSGGRRGRLSGAETLADAGAMLSRGFESMGRIPTSRMVAFQAPAAGELADELIKGTLADRPLQYVVRSRGILDTLFALLAPAKCTWDMENAAAAGDEAGFRAAEKRLKWAIREALPTLVPAMKKVREREAKQAAALVDLLDMADLDMLGVDVNEKGQPVSRETGQVVDIGDIFVAMLFAEWVPVANPAPTNEEDPAHV
jgi:hypothetical protein